MKELLYVVPAMFPYGWAYASRALNISRLATTAGYHVTVLCDYLSDSIQWTEEGISQFENISIVTTTSKYASLRTIWDKLRVGFIIGKSINRYLENHHVDLIVCPMTGGKFPKVKRVARKHRIDIVLEICEWYAPSNWKFAKFDPRYWQFQYSWKYIFPKEQNVICISRLLKKHFTDKGARTIRIPTILDINNIQYKKYSSLNSPIKLVFIGGITGGKDELSALIELVCENNLPFSIEIYGPSEEAVIETLDCSKIEKEKLKEKVHVHGYVAQEELSRKILECDFGIIIRPDRRSSHAGFPTKLGEYFAAGLPVLANDTGDIGLYLKDGENGFVMRGNQKNDILEVLERVLSINDQDYHVMSTSARITADTNFNYSQYVSRFRKFMERSSKS